MTTSWRAACPALIILLAACGHEAEYLETPAAEFHSIADRGPTNRAVCIEHGGFPVAMGSVYLGDGAFHRSRTSSSPPYRYDLVENLRQGVFQVRERATGTSFLAVSFAEPKTAFGDDLWFKACLWPLAPEV